MQVSIILPAYNEENFIGRYLSELLREFKSEEIIVVCNGCTDRTPEIVKRLKKMHKNIKLMIFKEKIGKGAAIIEGFKCAKGRYIGFVDADGAFACSEIKKVMKKLEETDCAIASKWKDKKFYSLKMPISRKIFSRFWNLLVRFFLHLNFEDTQAGLKFFRREVLESINLDFVCRGYDFDVELLSKIRRKGFEIEEVATKIRLRTTTSFRPVHVPKMFFNLIRLSLKI